MEIYKIFKFEAAHKLNGLPPEHKCSRLHGHSFEVEIHVGGELDEEIGWVMDFGDLKRKFKPTYDRLDHHYLNDIEGIGNPTSENIARWIWEEIHDEIPGLIKVVLRETCTAGCSFTGGDG